MFLYFEKFHEKKNSTIELYYTWDFGIPVSCNLVVYLDTLNFVAAISISRKFYWIKFRVNARFLRSPTVHRETGVLCVCMRRAFCPVPSCLASRCVHACMYVCGKLLGDAYTVAYMGRVCVPSSKDKFPVILPDSPRLSFLLPISPLLTLFPF